MDKNKTDSVVSLHKQDGPQQPTPSRKPDNKSDKQATEATDGKSRKEVTSSTTGTTAPAAQAEQKADVSSPVQETFDHAMHAYLARYTHGLSPAALMAALFDWSTHLTAAPGKQAQLAQKAADKARRHIRFAISNATAAGEVEPCIEPLPQDDRFSDDAWQMKPFNMIYQGFLLQQQWWHNAVTGVPGVTAQHERELQFLMRQVLDMYSPSNFLFTNPEILRKTRNEAGQNLIRGAQNLMQDLKAEITDAPPAGVEDFQPGRDVALSEGKVVYRNRLIELIQYSPVTDKVRPEPILIVPAWIMKYYILDLSPEKSLVNYLVGQGYTVFMISWKNPEADDRDLTMEDYRQLGIMASINAVQAIVPNQKIHAAGYCLGGTLLSIATAAIARGEDDPFASLSLLASQVDFTEPGELQLFINESQLSFLDSVMWKQGYLDSGQMGGAFQMLRSNDLVWSRMVTEYLKGERQPMFDLMAWNADGTRMPYAMHSEYLRKLYLDNDLAEGRFEVEGRTIALSDIRVPVFAVGTEADHVAPWPSVFKIHALTDTDVTFALTSGGHNAGIVSRPGHPRRVFRVRSKSAMERHVDPQTWMEETPMQDGSWWEAWAEWLGERSGKAVAPPSMGNPKSGYPAIEDAPGTYVFQK